MRVYLDLPDRRVEVPAGENTVGRSRSSTVILQDRGVSRSHALLSVSGKRVSIQDLDSANGTYVNGRRLVGEVLLRTGDVLNLGKSELKLLIEEPTESMPKPDSPAPPPRVEPTRSEAVAVGDALAVGELLAQETGSWDRTQPMKAVKAGAPAAESEHEPETGRNEAETADFGDEVRELQQRRVGEMPDPDSPESTRPGDEIRDLQRRRVEEVPDADSPESTRPAVGGPQDEVPRRKAPDLKASGAITGSFLDQTGEEAVASTKGEVLPSLDDLDRKLASARAGRREPESRAAEGVTRDLSAETSPAFLPAAGLLPRIAAYVIDAVWMGAVAFGASSLVGGAQTLEGRAVAAAVYAGLSLLVSVIGWSAWGTTPGKRLFGLYVCREAGWIGISFGRALLRWLGYLLSALPLGAGFVLGAVSASRRTLHDRIAGTYVGRR